MSKWRVLAWNILAALAILVVGALVLVGIEVAASKSAPRIVTCPAGMVYSHDLDLCINGVPAVEVEQ